MKNGKQGRNGKQGQSETRGLSSAAWEPNSDRTAPSSSERGPSNDTQEQSNDTQAQSSAATKRSAARRALHKTAARWARTRCAARRGSWIEGVGLPIVLATRAMPEFWLGMVLLAVFSFRMGILPSGGAVSAGAVRLASRKFPPR